MITNLQSVDPERLGIEKGSRGDKWVSLGGGNRIDFIDGLEAGRYRNWRIGFEKREMKGLRGECRERQLELRGI